MPWAESSLQERSTEEWFASLVGEVPIRVQYLIPDDALVADSIEFGTTFDQVDLGLELLMQSGRRVLLTWFLRAELEGLFMGQIDDNEPLVSSGGTPLADEWKWQRVNVSQRLHWKLLLGQAINKVGASWRECSPSIMSVWAVRLNLGHDYSVVIALGETTSSASGNPPDSVVIIFDEMEAKSYDPPGASISAWGETIDLRGGSRPS